MRAAVVVVGPQVKEIYTFILFLHINSFLHN